MKALWSGDINFGLVNIPVKLFSAVREKTKSFHLLSPDGKCRLRQKLVCEKTGEEFDFKQAIKGYERAPNQYVLFKKEELAALRPEANSSLEISDFVEIAEIDPRHFDRPYFVVPDKRSLKPYKLLMESMTQTGQVAIARFTMRRKNYLAAIRPLNHSLTLSILRYQDELLAEDDVPRLPELKKVALSAKERQMGVQLIEQMATHFNAGKYRNEDLRTVSQAIAKKEKIKGSKKVASDKDVELEDQTNERGAKVIDLFEALKRSVHAKDSSKKTIKKSVKLKTNDEVSGKKAKRTTKGRRIKTRKPTRRGKVTAGWKAARAG